MTLKLGMEHCVCEYYQDCSNYLPGLTLTHFTPRSNLVTYAFVLEKVKIIYFLETIAALKLKLVFRRNSWSIWNQSSYKKV